MKYQSLIEQIIKNVGGKENVVNVIHCMTRLRFTLADESKANTEVLKKVEGVLQVVISNGQYQVVIGSHVSEVYEELLQVIGFTEKRNVEPVKTNTKTKNTAVSGFLKLISEIFAPVLSILTASGMIKGLLSILIVSGLLEETDGTYIILNAVGDSLFYFFPMVLGYTTAKRFDLNGLMGVVIGGILVYPNLTALTSGEAVMMIFEGNSVFQSNVYTTFLKIPVILPTYSNTVIPIILITYVASKLDKYFNQIIPKVVKSFFVPFLTLLITAPLGLLIIGPIAVMLQNMLGATVAWLIDLNAGIAGFFVGTFWTVLVMFGLHWGVIPLFAINIASYGFDVIRPLIFAGSLATCGAVLAVIIKTKSLRTKNIAYPALISAFFAINEPALYGVLIPRKKVFISTLLSAGIGGAICGFAGSKLYAFGASGILGLPCYINPEGIDTGFIALVVGGIISGIIAFIASFIFVDTTSELDAPDTV